MILLTLLRDLAHCFLQQPTANTACDTEQAFDESLRQRRPQEVWIGRQRAVDHSRSDSALHHVHR